MPQIDAEIISNVKIFKAYYLLRLEVDNAFKDAQPGQFVHVKVGGSDEPLLRRPFSVHAFAPVQSKTSGKKCSLDILYEVKGKGTQLLAEKKQGELINLLGPLGNGFDYAPNNKAGKLNILIAGGMGVVPLSFLSQKLTASKKLVLIGSAAENKILCEDEFRKSGCEVKIATEDGSRGLRGKVTDLFKRVLLKLGGSQAPMVYACGPKAMLTVLAKMCMIEKIPLQVSLEEFMGCGIGACLGCAVETKQGFRRVCADGPVFNAEDIVWKF